MPALATLESISARVSSGGTPSRKNAEYFTKDSSGHLWVKSKELLDCAIEDTEERITDDGLEYS
jgi:type I restriction enzyme S subunit